MTAPRRRWFRFSLRTLFVVVTVSGIVVGWVIWQRQIVRERRAMRGWLQSQKALILPDMYWAELSIRGSRNRREHHQKLNAIERRRSTQMPPVQLSLPFVRRWWGDEPVEGIWLSDALAGRRPEIERLFPEAAIVLESEAVCDELSERARQIPRILAEPTRVEFENAPLEDIVEFLKDVHNVEIQLDAPALEKVGVDGDVPLSFHARDVPLRDVLTELLTPLKLTIRIKQHVVLVTTEE